jgi:hypothetical protein
MLALRSAAFQAYYDPYVAVSRKASVTRLPILARAPPARWVEPPHHTSFAMESEWYSPFDL